MANPNDWSQFYENQSFFTTTATVATTVTTTSASGDARLSPETGRVSKPARRRSRASRRTPTTLLNTDTSNFRAMVQQFTGGPSAMTFGSGSGSGSGFTLTPPSSNTALGVGIGGVSHARPSWQYTLQHQATHAPLQHQQRPYMLSLNNVNPNIMGVIGGVNAAIPDVIPAEEEGGEGSDQPSQVLGSRNENISSWLQ